MTATDPRDKRPPSLPVAELCLGNGWHAGIGVDTDGSIWPWLLDPTSHRGEAVFPPHELVGPLPWQIKERLRRRYCGAPTKTGALCRIEVGQPGQHCHHHRKDAA